MASNPQSLIRIENATVDDWRDYPDSMLKIYYLQEVQASPQALKDIVWILKELLQKTSCRLVCVEASSGPANPDEFRESLKQLVIREERVRAVMQFIENGMMAPEQALWSLGEDEFDIFGIEDEELYWRVINAGERSYELRSQWARIVGSGNQPPENSLRGDLLRRGPNSKLLATFLREYKDGDILVLLRYAEQLGIELNPLIRPLQAMKSLERLIDFDKANEEIQVIVSELDSALTDFDRSLSRSLERIAPAYESASPQILQQALCAPVPAGWPSIPKHKSTLLYKLVDYARRNKAVPEKPMSVQELLDLYRKTFADLTAEVEEKFSEYQQEAPKMLPRALDATTPNGISMKTLGALYQYWAELMVLLDIPPDTCPNVIKYIWYCNRAGRIDIGKAIAAMNSLQDTVRNRLSEDIQDQEFLRLFDLLEHLSCTLLFQALGTSVNEVNKKSSELEHTELCASLEQLIPERASLQEFSRLGADYKACYDGCMLWYRLQSDRANIFFENTLSRMFEEGESQAILLAGGFQRQEVVARFHQQHISYVVLSPVIRQETSESEMKTYIERLLTQSRMRKAAHDNLPEQPGTADDTHR
jgi:hypothetical protein